MKLLFCIYLSISHDISCCMHYRILLKYLLYSWILSYLFYVRALTVYKNMCLICLCLPVHKVTWKTSVLFMAGQGLEYFNPLYPAHVFDALSLSVSLCVSLSPSSQMPSSLSLYQSAANSAAYVCVCIVCPSASASIPFQFPIFLLWPRLSLSSLMMNPRTMLSHKTMHSLNITVSVFLCNQMKLIFIQPDELPYCCDDNKAMKCP